MKVIFLIVIFIVGVILLSRSKCYKEKEIDKVCLEDLHLQLIGVVEAVDKGNNYHGYGIIRLKVISSNIQEYDPRTKLEFYFCVIKNGVAEIYDHTSNTFKGDTLIYDTKVKMGGYLRNGKREYYGSISVYGYKPYYDYIKQHTIFR